ncbi:MAG: PASTA domain-containing protein [bacterium]|nr:PASTA domain-containing protein [bacterium]
MKPFKNFIGKWAARVMIIFFTWAVLFLILDKIVLPIYTRKYQEEVIPNFIGTPFYQAQLVAKQTGYQIVEERKRPVVGVLPQTIVDQRPHPGTRTKTGRLIYVTVSTQAKQTIVPNLFEKTPREAELVLEDVGLELSTNYEFEYSEMTTAGCIIKQNPMALSRVLPGTKVSVVISLGPEMGKTTVPDLIGLTYEEAILLLKRKNLNSSDPYYKRSISVGEGRVISQKPNANEVVNVGTTVELTLSTGEQ